MHGGGGGGARDFSGLERTRRGAFFIYEQFQYLLGVLVYVVFYIYLNNTHTYIHILHCVKY